MPGSIRGSAVIRVEDPDLTQGRGSYVDNLELEGVLHLVFVRSPLAHGVIRGIDVRQALDLQGVVAAYTATDIELPPLPGFAVLNQACAPPPLAKSKVRFVGEPVVAIVAESAAAAVDATRLVRVDYEPLSAVIDPECAIEPSAPLLFDEIKSNVAAGVREAESTEPLSGADAVVRARMENQRIAVIPLEGNAIAVVPGDDGSGHDLTIYVSTQTPHAFRTLMAKLFNTMPERLRVVAPHVGGAFGGKSGILVEHAVAIAAACKLQRPIKWVETRSENMVVMPHGRGQTQYVEMGLKTDGTITGLRCRIIADAGAYAGSGGWLAMGPTYTMMQGVYRIPAVSYDAVVVLTNTTPVGALRGAGRLEATSFLERIVDIAAAELRLDPVDIRRRNLLQPNDFPFTTAGGATYDSGDYDVALTTALRLADYDTLRAEQAKRRDRGDTRLLGIGVSTYVETTGDGGDSEYASVEIHPDGTATVKVGTSDHGQGHATSFSVLVADRLGLPMNAIRFVQSDTAVIPRGRGTGGSRSLQLGGSAVYEAAGAVWDRAQDLAAVLLEANVDDIVLANDGRIRVRDVPASTLTWAELALTAEEAGEPLRAAVDFVQAGATFPFGAHVATVEVDAETGLVTPIRHIAVDDCGRMVNPLIVRGQQHGGIVQGVAQALWERYGYDSDGSPLTPTLAEYTLPTAADVPPLLVANTQTPTPLNPLGAKGIGESATIGSTPAMHNAVIDALSHLGVRHIDMPCTAERVWRAIQDAGAGTLPTLWRDPPAVFASQSLRDASPRRPLPTSQRLAESAIVAHDQGVAKES